MPVIGIQKAINYFPKGEIATILEGNPKLLMITSEHNNLNCIIDTSIKEKQSILIDH